MTVYAASKWKTNGELIADVAKLGYLKKTDIVLDPTYGEGIWWQNWEPNTLVYHDLHKLKDVDFRFLPYRDGSFDAVAFDPPYVSIGGRKTSTLDDFNDRFGVHRTPTTPAGLQQYMHDGFDECLRVVKSKGIILWKCCDYVSSGKIWLGTHLALTHALDRGCFMEDRFELIGHARAQPKRTRKDGSLVTQQHARRNLSTLFVLRAPKK